jgi:hypothetical protein
MIRGPLPLNFDHFVLVWSRGSAVVALLPYGGRIHGGASDRWLTEQRLDHSVSETSFENPYLALSKQREALKEALHSSSAAIPAGELHEDDREPFGPTLIAIFNGDLADVRVHDIPDKSFNAISIDYALSRTMFHMPNLLRLSDRGSSIYSTKELDAITNKLESAAALEERNSGERREKQLQSFRRAREKRVRTRVSFTWVAAAVVVGIVLYVLLRPSSPETASESDQESTSTTTQQNPRSAIVIRLPVETQLFVSSQAFTSRSQVDSALSHGAGLRFLPDTLHVVRLDSLSFAKGVYGYFKVDNAWRKGKLLQTFKPRDTIVVDNFLDPLN